MGSLAAAAKTAYIEKLGKRFWQNHVEAIDEMWYGIKQRISRLRLPFNRVRIYQDGLPVCGREECIIDALAGQGSPNHLIVEWLVKRGATLVGTEDPELLIQEYDYVKRIIATPSGPQRENAVREYEKVAPELLKKRDHFIQNRIDRTLPQGGIGLLFVGLLHRVDELLPADIRVSYLIYRLPFQRSFEMELLK
ncbi:MAG: hypothetical protein QME66_00580 [Candidatus Eisenbacteria bacterium]|nr:hypothetical protein [Candidatus Eisenbacteria bacterium]